MHGGLRRGQLQQAITWHSMETTLVQLSIDIARQFQHVRAELIDFQYMPNVASFSLISLIIKFRTSPCS